MCIVFGVIGIGYFFPYVLLVPVEKQPELFQKYLQCIMGGVYRFEMYAFRQILNNSMNVVWISRDGSHIFCYILNSS